MTALLAFLARLKPLGPLALAFLRAHWRLVAVALLALVAVLGVRGCRSYASKLDASEQVASAARSQLRAEFDAELAQAKAESAALAERLAATDATPVAVFSGKSGRQTVPPRTLPAAPAKPSMAPVDMAGTTSPEGNPCVLAIGDAFEMTMTGVEVRAKDGGHLVIATTALDAENGLHLDAIVTAPVTLPPPDLTAPEVRVQVERARWALRAGLVDPKSLGGVYLGGGVRVWGGWWLEAEGRVDGSVASTAAGARFEW